ncbi:MAG: hypothetical protein ACLFQX_04100 [Candidatus Kapaibacterium sp.]
MNAKKFSLPLAIIRVIDQAAVNIAREVPFQLWDECIELLLRRLSLEADKASSAPVSAFLTAEVEEKIHHIQKEARYLTLVQQDD